MWVSFRTVVGVVGLAAAAAGCRTATHVTEVPRVDLSLERGNRGYLVGVPPEAARGNTTRQMVQTDIEVPSFYKPKRTGGQVGLDEVSAPEQEAAEIQERLPAGAKVFDVYTVQKGDSLWSIAAQPAIYGKGTQWRRIFDANRDVLKGPDRVRPGMTLKIPRGESGGGPSTTYDDEGVTYKK